MRDDALPLVSICIPTYNAAKTIRQTLLSILGQTYPNLIVNVVDNASEDETLAIVESIKDSRVSIHRNSSNIGAEGNFNRCIQLASGTYTAIYHADDIYEPTMVEQQVRFLDAFPNAGAVLTEARVIDGDGVQTGYIAVPSCLSPERPCYDFLTIFRAVLLHSNFLICPSVMVRTPIYRNEIAVWRGNLFGSAADLDVWLRIAQKHDLGFIHQPLMQYRVWASQWSAKVRLETGRSGLFPVVEHYLESDSLREKLSLRDQKNLACLDRRDRVMRAVNFFLQGNLAEVAQLCRDAFSKEALLAAFQSRRGALVFLLGAYLKALSFFGAQSLGRASLIYMKRKTNT